MAEAGSMLAVVAEFIASEFGCEPEEITRETVAMDIDGWDSASHVILVLETEKTVARYRQQSRSTERTPRNRLRIR